MKMVQFLFHPGDFKKNTPLITRRGDLLPWYPLFIRFKLNVDA
jgi:hypothetical protein